MPRFKSMIERLLTIVHKRSALSVFAWLVIITLLCSMPGQYIPSNNWLELLSVDKLVHAFIFGTLAILLFVFALKRQGGRGAIMVCFLFTTAYGIGMELMQAYAFSNRSADWQDAVANTLGACIALFFVKRLKQFIKTL